MMRTRRCAAVALSKRGLGRSATPLLLGWHRQLTLSSGSFMKPHPDKQKAGLPGEDALFCVGDDTMVVAGVSDGTSFKEGGVYARQLISEAESLVQRAVQAGDDTDPRGLLQAAWEATALSASDVEGRATACFMTVDGGRATVRASLVGDSGLMVLSAGNPRRGVRYSWHDNRELESQQHYFNCPFQLGKLEGEFAVSLGRSKAININCCT